MILIEENKIERSVAVQFRQFEVDVGEVVLGEHAFLFANFDVAEFSRQIALTTFRRILF